MFSLSDNKIVTCGSNVGNCMIYDVSSDSWSQYSTTVGSGLVILCYCSIEILIQFHVVGNRELGISRKKQA